MNTLELRTNLHKLIDTINNDNLLHRFYNLLDRTVESKEGQLWSGLSMEEQEELSLIESESHDPANLISHTKMKSKHAKWL
ncbi:MAG: hypothetical protein K9H64_21360 [Bacteroidales bacterium]|nr:hypothetical protein [Bacteroidales bacterium]MCF8458589.1 hypothetical protein [Bacteroidales bacterium]